MKIIKKIAFLLHHEALIDHWNNIFKRLDSKRFDVIITQENTFFLEKYLKDNKIKYILSEDLINRNEKYLYLISNHVGGEIAPNHYFIEQLGIYHIRYLYALGKSKWNFAVWNQCYDMILCMGPYQSSKLSYTKAIKKEIGYSRYDDFFNKKIDKQAILQKLNCDKRKQTICWIPTWKELCSIENFFHFISKLSDEYNVIVKPHPLTISNEPEKLELLRKNKYTMLIENPLDNLYLLSVGDFIVCDYGGPPFGAIYTDKNLLLLNSESEKNSPNLDPDSPDIYIRKKIINIDADKGNSLLEILKNKSIWREQKESRSVLRKIFFSKDYGTSTSSFLKVLNNLEIYLPLECELCQQIILFSSKPKTTKKGFIRKWYHQIKNTLPR